MCDKELAMLDKGARDLAAAEHRRRLARFPACQVCGAAGTDERTV